MDSNRLGATLLVLCGSLLADISPVPGTLPVAPVFNAADLVCNCVVEKTEATGQRSVGEGRKAVTRQQVSATVRVEDEYKSTLPGGRRRVTLEFEQERPPTSVSIPSVERGERALMFLKASGDSTFVFADRFLGAVPFDSIPQVSEAPGLGKLQTALAGISRSSNQQDQIRAMELLSGFDHISATTVSAISQLGDSPNPKVALAAVSVLLRAGVASGDTQDALLRLSAYLQAHGNLDEMLANVGGELGLVNDARSLELVEVLSGSKSVAIRRGALQSLRAMRNPAASRTLVMRLDDGDGYVRYLSVMTLAETFGKHGDYAPTMNLFDQNPEFYVGLWKSWWQAAHIPSSR
jgi:HEAT repeat protein